MKKQIASVCGVALLAGSSLQAQVTISPLSSFGNNGWLYPNGVNGSTYSFLGTANTERGMAYGNNQLYLASRNGGSFIRILNATTGADLGALDMTGISGGTFAINMVGVAADGAIYAANLASPLNGTTPFKVYRWANASAVPTLAFSSTTITAGRMGDSLDVIGSGTSTRIVAGESNSSGTGTRNGYAVLTTSDGLNFGASLVNFTSVATGAQGGTAPGDFRLGVTFAGQDRVLGTQGSTGQLLRNTGSDGTYNGAGVLSTGLERPMDYASIDGFSLLATISTGDSRVRIYDAADPNNLVLLTTSTGTLSTANGNGTGAVSWGDVVSNPDGSATATLYAMSSNNGIEAFVVQIPEPGTLVLAGLGLASLSVFRRRQ